MERARDLRWLWLLVVMFVAFSCSGCGNGSSSTTTGPTAGGGSTGSGGQGTLTLRITDSPFGEAVALLVTFSQVQVHLSGTGWQTLPFVGQAPNRTCDLKDLTGGATDVLGVGPLDAGHYTQIRLVVLSAVVYTTGTPSAAGPCASDASLLAPTGTPDPPLPVDVPSGELKLNRQFELLSGGATTILLDFDGEKSLRLTGNGKYILQLVIGVVSVS
jgi:Domain of unknown function (DUF4382)